MTGDRGDLRTRLHEVRDIAAQAVHRDAPDEALVRALAAIRKLADLNEPVVEIGWQ